MLQTLLFRIPYRIYNCLCHFRVTNKFTEVSYLLLKKIKTLILYTHGFVA